MCSRALSYLSRLLHTLAVFILLIGGGLVFPEGLAGETLISLREYSTRAIPVSNPMDLTKLPLGEVYQVNHPHFIIQFFFSSNHILGIIFKREREYPLYVRWCFFRDCEDSPYDYTAVLANPLQPPFNEDFFQVRVPVRFNYKFHGLHFFTGISAKPPG